MSAGDPPPTALVLIQREILYRTTHQQGRPRAPTESFSQTSPHLASATRILAGHSYLGKGNVAEKQPRSQQEVNNTAADKPQWAAPTFYLLTSSLRGITRPARHTRGASREFGGEATMIHHGVGIFGGGASFVSCLPLRSYKEERCKS